VASVLRVALTGGIASGKSTCLAQFAALGAPTVDADVLAHRALDPGSPGLDAVIARFGRSLLNADGSLDRARLADIVFNDPSDRRDLEAIVHPVVYEAIQRWFDDLGRRANGPRIGIADIPLLYETGRDHDFDRVIVVVCSRERQIQRVMARDHLDLDAAEARLNAQWPLETKRTRADEVIDTDGTKAETADAVKAVWAKLLRI
jgi:dephospho-CoA kinase